LGIGMDGRGESMVLEEEGIDGGEVMSLSCYSMA
jgi:hypothetical protein